MWYLLNLFACCRFPFYISGRQEINRCASSSKISTPVIGGRGGGQAGPNSSTWHVWSLWQRLQSIQPQASFSMTFLSAISSACITQSRHVCKWLHESRLCSVSVLLMRPHISVSYSLFLSASPLNLLDVTYYKHEAERPRFDARYRQRSTVVVKWMEHECDYSLPSSAEV
jgi:hypothetical protein